MMAIGLMLCVCAAGIGFRGIETTIDRRIPTPLWFVVAAWWIISAMALLGLAICMLTGQPVWLFEFSALPPVEAAGAAGAAAMGGMQ